MKEAIAMFNDLNELKQACAACTKCELCQTRHNVVFGVGKEDAEILFVGEAPGENEDLQGEPFVGRGGQLLDLYLNGIGLDRKENIYIANMLKCRPPHNRDPKPEEMDVCIPWLRNLVFLMRPKIIVCVGRISAQRLISPDFKVTKEHGVFFRKGKLKMCAVYHPAALLRDPHKKEDMLLDMKNIKAFLDGNFN